MKITSLLLFTLLISCSTKTKVNENVAKENAHWKKLGVSVDARKIILDNPYPKSPTPKAYILPTDEYKKASKDKFRKIQRDNFLKDLDILKMAMSRGYGGWDVAQKKGFNWDLFFDNWKKDIAGLNKKVTVDRAFESFKSFQDFQLDNHSGVVTKKHQFRHSMSKIVDGEVTTYCSKIITKKKTYHISKRDKGLQPKQAYIYNDESQNFEKKYYLTHPSHYKNVQAVVCGGKEISLVNIDQKTDRYKNINALSKQDQNYPSFRNIDPNTAYLRLPTFTATNTERLVKLYKKLPKTAGSEQQLIVDLRGNQGGDGESAFEVLSKWINFETIKKYRAMPFERVDSCIAKSLRWGYTQFSTQRLTPPVSKFQRNNIEREYSIVANQGNHCERKVLNSKAPWNLSMRKPVSLKNRKIISLVDNFCGSDCEYITYILGSMPESIVVGQNTFGVAQYIQPGYMLLPNTKTIFRMARGVSNIYGDHRSLDGHGIDVDILLTGPNQMGPDSIIALVKKLK